VSIVACEGPSAGIDEATVKVSVDRIDVLSTFITSFMAALRALHIPSVHMIAALAADPHFLSRVIRATIKIDTGVRMAFSITTRASVDVALRAFIICGEVLVPVAADPYIRLERRDAAKARHSWHTEGWG
jgi:anaerobic C4-dicarboxylate transporter